MRQLEVIDLEKTYIRDGVPVKILDHVTFGVKKGEAVSIVGPLNSGKTTLCRIMAGQERPTSGRVLLNGREVMSPSTRIALIPHATTIFPWFNVRRNVELGVEAQDIPEEEKERRIDAWIDFFDLRRYEDMLPKDLQAPIQYKIILARSMTVNPDVLILDDPFRCGDEFFTRELMDEIDFIRKRFSKTIIIATEKILEALMFSNKIVTLGPMPSTVKGIEIIPPKYKCNVAVLARLHEKILDLMRPEVVSEPLRRFDMTTAELTGSFRDTIKSAKEVIEMRLPSIITGLKIAHMLDSVSQAKKDEKANVRREGESQRKFRLLSLLRMVSRLSKTKEKIERDHT